VAALPAELAAIASGLGQDAGIGLEVGDHWAWDPVRRVLIVSSADVVARGAAYCAGIVAHEVGHVLISRYLALPVVFPNPAAGMAALNAIEDPRVEHWIGGRFPGARAWLRLGRGEAHVRPAIASAFFAYCFAAAAEGENDFRPSGEALPQGVAEALDATRDARRRYRDTAPPTDLGVRDAIETQLRYLHEVHPRMRGAIWPPELREQAIRLSAHDALELATAEILPTVAELYLRDRERIARHLQRHPETAAAAREHLRRGGGAFPGLGNLFGEGGEAAGDDARALADALLGAAASGRSHRPLTEGATARARPGRGGDAGSRAADARLRLPPSELPYERARRHVSAQIDALVQHLETILRPRRRLGARAGYPSGHRLDLRRVMTFEADPRRWNELWMRPTIPDRHEVAIGLLVDLSGSMSGAPARNALLGTVLLAETLERLGIDYAIDGFQDELIPFCAFHERLDATVQARIAEMPKEAGGSRPGGHNQASYNDDGPCLLAFAEKVQARPASERVVIVVSDGVPAGRRSGDEDLHRAVRTLRQPGADLRLIGLGLGPGTGHVRRFYPEHRADVPIAQLARQIGAVIEQVLIGDVRRAG
jgi:hypothetical protein